MRSSMFAMVAAAVAVLQVAGVRGFEQPFYGKCMQDGLHYDAFVGDDAVLSTGFACRDWCLEHQAVMSEEPVAGFSMKDNECLCHVLSGTFVPGATSLSSGDPDLEYLSHFTFAGNGPLGSIPAAEPRPNSGDGVSGYACFQMDFDAGADACPINLIVGLDQTSMKKHDTSLETFKEVLFEFTDQMTIGPTGMWMEVAYLQGHKQNGNKHKKQITTAMSVADSMAGDVDPRDFVTETEIIRRPRTPFLSFLGVDVPLFVETIDDAERPTFCLIFTNKGDFARGKEKKEFRKFAKAFKENPPCVPFCFQNSPRAGGPSFLARVLCGEAFSAYSDAYDMELLKEMMCTIPAPTPSPP